MNSRLTLFAAVASLALVQVACTKKDSAPAADGTAATTTTAPADTAAPAAPAGTTASVTELKIEELKPGTGTEAAAGKMVSVHYTGWLTNGTKFDSSLDRGQPFEFPLGAGRVIQGWDKGVAGMKVGGKRKLTIPSHMAYGEMGHPPVIPPNSTLVFEVELLDVK